MLSFQHTLEFWKQPEVSWSQVRAAAYDPWQRCLFLLKTVTLEAKNVPAHSRGEESMSDFFTTLLTPHGINKPFQHMHIECLINSSPSGYKFKVDDNPDVKKADQHCFDLGL
jgi:hypothetical protein